MLSRTGSGSVMYRRFGVWHVTAISLVGLLMIGFLVYWFNLRPTQSYPMPRTEYLAQAYQITPGMSVDDVRQLLRGVTRETDIVAQRVSFIMEPHSKPSWTAPPPAVNISINVNLDQEEKVVDVFTTESGKPGRLRIVTRP